MTRKFVCTPTEPVVQTKAGKLRGFQLDSTYIFQGVEYAYADRFQAPHPVKPWEGVKDALSYGYVCPLMHQGVPNGEVMVPHRYWPMDEHCQNLNIWTQSLDPGAKKPVMVWLHGGGFSAGSAIEQQAYDGESMSIHGDCVVVTINHRLNVLGYCDLEPFGEKYKNSGNAGNADMVAALQWIHENIANFGGDPENVTIFGQSGGGMKVYSLMQTPAADGLFHKGIIMSGVLGGIMQEKKADGRALVLAMLKHLGLEEKDVEKLETIPYEQLVEAYEAVSPELGKKGEYTGQSPLPNGFYAGDPRTAGLTENARKIPVMIGTVFGEFAFGKNPPLDNDMTEAEKVAKIKEKYGENSEEFIEKFKKAWPEKDLVCLLTLDYLFRAPTIQMIDCLSQRTESPTYSYVFGYDFPYDGGKTAWHCSDIPFFFNNIHMIPVCNEPGVTDKLQYNLFNAVMNFARTGDPNHAGIPQWDSSTPGAEHTMIFDRECSVRTNFDRDLVLKMEKVMPPFFLAIKKDEPIQH